MKLSVSWRQKKGSKMVNTLPLLLKLKYFVPTNEKVMVSGRRGSTRNPDFEVYSVSTANNIESGFTFPSDWDKQQSQCQHLLSQQRALSSLLLGFIINLIRVTSVFMVTNCSTAIVFERQLSTSRWVFQYQQWRVRFHSHPFKMQLRLSKISGDSLVKSTCSK